MARPASPASMVENRLTCPTELGGVSLRDRRVPKAKRALLLVLLPLALSVSSCEIAFTPDIEPLVIPTAPPQPFAREMVDGSPQSPPIQQPASGSGQEEPFDPEDPEDWIRRIEAKWANINVIGCELGYMAEACVRWPGGELELLYGTLSDHILAGYLDQPILMIRTDSDDFAGLTINWSVDGVLSSDVRISDGAWRSSPAMGFLDLFDSLFDTDSHFQGTIAHELTHAAVWFHPELLEWWIDAQEAAGESIEPGDWRIGYRYDWSVYEQLEDNPELYELTVQGELFAMTVSALMYDPWWIW